MSVFLKEIRVFLKRISELSRWLSPVWAGIIQSTEGLHGTKRQRKVEFTLLLTDPENNLLLPLVLLVLGPSHWIGISFIQLSGI